MKFLRPLLALGLLVIVLVAVWLWWSLPAKVDMADYAPADSLVYVEFNNPAAVVHAIQNSTLWQAAAPITQSKPASQSRVAATAARAGLGPLPAVLFARAQVALAMIGMNTIEEENSLKVRPEFALIVETHTSKWRIKPAAVEAVKQLANFSYGASMCTERSADADYVECSVSGSERKVIGAVDGTLVVIGNSDNAVRSCLEARRGVRPNLRTDTEMVKVRSSVVSDKTLGFGYVSPTNSAKLFSWMAPLMILQSPGEQLLQLFAVSAGKVLRGVAWTASSAPQGIEDRFLFSLDPGVVSRLQPAFTESEPDEGFWKFVPEGFQSLTIYRNKAPATAWSSLSSAVSFKLDAVPAALFGTLLKSSLSVYGISNPKEALTVLNPPLLTLKPSESAAEAILVARVNDPDRLKQSLAEVEILEGLESNPDPKKEFTAVFVNDYVLLGKTENVRAGLLAIRKGVDADPKKYHNYLSQASNEREGVIVTFTNDEERVNNFLSTLVQLQGRKLSTQELESLRNVVRTAGVAATDTRLNAFGIERRTRSAFGQFSTLTSLLQSGR